MPRYFSERGHNYEEALDKIHKKYGDRIRTLMYKNVPAPGLLGLLGRELVEITGYIAVGEEARTVQKNRDNETRAAILAAAGKSIPAVSTNRGITPESGSSEEMKDGELGAVLQEIRDLKERLPIAASMPPPEPFPALSELEEILRENDFEREYIVELTGSLRAELKAAELDDRKLVHGKAAELIASSFNCYKDEEKTGPRVFVLVGPTGVGKTTTIAKLAAVNGLSDAGADVRIFTVDSFRIGARAQVETYGEIMGIPVKAIDDFADLKAQIALAADADLILVDTIGKSPRDVAKIEEMRLLLQACGENAEVHLALSATTKTVDLSEIMEHFEIFDYRSVVLTKLDETSRVGNLISVLSRKGVPVSYLTDGQSVPVDISVASAARIISRLKGLEYDRNIIAERYPATDLTAAWR